MKKIIPTNSQWPKHGQYSYLYTLQLIWMYLLIGYPLNLLITPSSCPTCHNIISLVSCTSRTFVSKLCTVFHYSSGTVAADPETNQEGWLAQVSTWVFNIIMNISYHREFKWGERLTDCWSIVCIMCEVYLTCKAYLARESGGMPPRKILKKFCPQIAVLTENY